MELTIKVSPDFLKKAKAFKALTDADNLDLILSNLLEQTLDDAIVAALGALNSNRQGAGTDIEKVEEHYKAQKVPALLSELSTVQKAPKPQQEVVSRRYDPPEDVTALTDGLGDDEDNEGGLSADDIDRDMSVSDPDKEAIADASDLAIFGESAEDIFARAANLPRVDDQVRTRNGRAARRQEIRKAVSTPRRGKVTGFEDQEESSF